MSPLSGINEPSQRAVERMCAALEAAGFAEGQVVLTGYGTAYATIQALTDAALNHLGAYAVTGEQMLADDTLIATGFVGAPDRFFALCRAGYGQVLERALVAGGVAFPIVHAIATQQSIILTDAMLDAHFGPYALRQSRADSFAVLEQATVSILRAGSNDCMPHGMIGEVVLREEPDALTAIRSGVLSAWEQVPHRYRAPGLKGWMGFVVPAKKVYHAQVRAGDVASVINQHEQVLDARLVSHPKDAEMPILQIETEAGEWIDNDVLATFEARTGLRPILERVVPGKFGNTGRLFGLQVA